MQKLGMALAVLLGLAGSVRADFIVSNFNTKNFANPGVTTPYATLTVTGDEQINGVVTFDLIVDAPNSAFVDKLGFNTSLSLADFTLGSVLIGDASQAVLHNDPQQSPYQMDGFGSFMAQFDNGHPGSSSGYSELKFTLNVLNGQTALASNFFVANNNAALDPVNGFHYASDFFPTEGGTGFIGDSGTPTTTTVTPEPASITLLSTGAVFGIGLWLRNRRRKPPEVAVA